MMINNAIIYTEEIIFQRSSRAILSDISLQIPEGLTIFTGDNGAGKSTLLKILGNIYTPSSGTLYYCNNKYKRYSSFMFQEPIFLNRTVNDNIKHALKCHKASKMNYQHLIKEYLDKFSIGHLIDSYPRNLSTGEKRIISFIRAIIVNPSIIFLDEPCAHLDINYQKLISSHINNVSNNIPVVLVSHNNELGFYDYSKIYTISNGTIT